MKHTKNGLHLKNNARKGFTLIELLVVIAIIAILSVVVILTLNPAELLRQARDSNRVSDMGTLKSAISLYLADVSSPTLSSTCAASIVSSGVSNTCNGRYGTVAFGTSSQSGVLKIDGTGWVSVNFNAISSGAPVGALPKDPTNSGAGGASSTQLFYSYRASSTPLTFNLVAKMESTKYSASGTADVETTDGGKLREFFETGTDLSGI